MNILSNRKFNNKSAVVIGKFDGVHKGHQHLLSLAEGICEKENLTPLAYTFSSYGECITDDTQKSQLLALYGMEHIYIQQFNEDFKNTSPEEFVRILKEDLNAEHVIIGFNFRFGKNRCGSAADMAELCRHTGIGVTIAEPVIHDGEPISSTRIRNAILNGNVAEACAMMGRPFSVTASVKSGKHLGREIGFPTANMSTYGITLLPQDGVYATAAVTSCGTYPAITNIGTNPTVDHDNKIKIETNIIGFDGDLYGKEISVAFMDKLRKECTFENIDELKNQLAKDREKAIEIFNEKTEQ